MKKIQLILAFLAVVLMAPSCSNDGGDSKISTQSGAVPNIQKTATDDSSINLIAVTNGDPIHLGFTVDLAEGAAAVQSLDVVLFYFKGNGDVYRTVLESGVTTFPKSFSLTQNDLFDKFDQLNSGTDFEIGDQLVVTADITLKDGTVLKLLNNDGSSNYSPNIANSSQYAVLQTYDVSCPLDDASNFSGDYKVVTDEWADYGAGDIIPLDYQPEADGTFTFRILSTNNTFISNPDTSYLLVTIDPDTATATVTSNEDFVYPGFDVIHVTGSGTVGSCTGSVDLDLTFGQYGSFHFSIVKN